MAQVVAVARDRAHGFSKGVADAVRLIEGMGVEGDAHCGVTVQHRSRVAVDPTQPNLRQVHLIGVELLDELSAKGFTVGPGALGENITTEGIDLMALPQGAVLGLGHAARIRITGLRNPCAQIEAFQTGLLAEVLDRREDGELLRKAGVMAVVLAGGWVRARDIIAVTLPDRPHRALERV